MNCQKHHHNKEQLLGNEQILAMYSLCFQKEGNCMNKLFCSSCQEGFQQLPLQNFLCKLERLSSTQNENLKDHFNKISSLVEKYKYVQEFKKAMERLQQKIVKQFNLLFVQAEEIEGHFSQNKKNVDNLIKDIVRIDDLEQIKEFQEQKIKIISNFKLQHNKLTYQNNDLEQVSKKCQQSIKSINKNFILIKDYSLKIIQVVISRQDDDEEEESLKMVKKCFERHKQYLKGQSNHKIKQVPSPSQVKKSVSTAYCQTQSKFKDHFESNRQRNRYLYEMEKKLKKVQERLILEIEQLLVENKKLKQNNEELKLQIERTKRDSWRIEKKESLNTTINSDRQNLLDRLLTLYENGSNEK